MKTKLNYTGYLVLFISIYLIVNLGFYKSYFSHLSDYSLLIHFHGAVMAAWFIYVITQTALMFKNNRKWHKYVGWSSVLLGILIIISIIGITKMGYNRDLKEGALAEKLNGQLLSFYMDILYFGLFYTIAIYKRKQLKTHIKYIIAATLVLFGPGIGRFMFFNFPQFEYTSFIANYYAYFILIGLWITESIRNKKITLKNNYLVIILMFVVYHYVNFNFGNSTIWQSIAQSIVNVLY